MKSLKILVQLVFAVAAALVIGIGAAGLIRLVSEVSGVSIEHDVTVGASGTLAGIFLGSVYQKLGFGKKKADR
jgi:hypothetical protein